MIGDDFENYGEKTPVEVAALLREWAAEHEDANYHEYVGPFESLAARVESLDTPIQAFVMRSPDLFGKALAEFYINPRRIL